MWNKGDRVLARRLPGEFYYPGIIRHIQDNRYFVIFADGEDAFVQDQQMLPLAFEIGDRVDVQIPGRKDYRSARVLDKQDNRVQVEFDDGGLTWLAVERLRVQPHVWKSPGAGLGVPHDWQVGDRVWACWFDLYWYPALVLHTEDGQVGLLFDHGGQASVSANNVMPLEFEEGDRIECRWKAGHEYFSGTVTRKIGEVIDVSYDDGDSETTSIRLARMNRDEWLPETEIPNLGPGDRVLGSWVDNFWYPGVILSIDGKRVHVLFDDNDQCFLTWDRLRALDVEVGDRVQSRFRGAQQFYPGEIVQKEGERILMRYDDGREEWTSVRLLRVER